MKNPDAEQDAAWDIQILSQHEKKADAHCKSYGSDHANLCKARHATPLQITFQIFLVKGSMDEPVMQSLRAFGEAERCKQQEWESWQQGNNGADGTQSQADTAQDDKQDLLRGHRVYSNVVQ